MCRSSLMRDFPLYIGNVGDLENQNQPGEPRPAPSLQSLTSERKLKDFGEGRGDREERKEKERRERGERGDIQPNNTPPLLKQRISLRQRIFFILGKRAFYVPSHANVYLYKTRAPTCIYILYPDPPSGSLRDRQGWGGGGRSREKEGNMKKREKEGGRGAHTHT